MRLASTKCVELWYAEIHIYRAGHTNLSSGRTGINHVCKSHTEVTYAIKIIQIWINGETSTYDDLHLGHHLAWAKPSRCI